MVLMSRRAKHSLKQELLLHSNRKIDKELSSQSVSAEEEKSTGYSYLDVGAMPVLDQSVAGSFDRHCEILVQLIPELLSTQRNI